MAPTDQNTNTNPSNVDNYRVAATVEYARLRKIHTRLFFYLLISVGLLWLNTLHLSFMGYHLYSMTVKYIFYTAIGIGVIHWSICDVKLHLLEQQYPGITLQD